MTSSSGYLVKKGPKHKYLQRMCMGRQQHPIKGTTGSGGNCGQTRACVTFLKGCLLLKSSQWSPFKNEDLLHIEQFCMHTHTIYTFIVKSDFQILGNQLFFFNWVPTMDKMRHIYGWETHIWLGDTSVAERHACGLKTRLWHRVLGSQFTNSGL